MPYLQKRQSKGNVLAMYWHVLMSLYQTIIGPMLAQ
jgi:hypothetical protein